MNITTLVENTSKNSELLGKHGLSFYIETKNHKILFDLGPDDLFLKNAKKLGIDIQAVDIVVISHAHKDHGGGLRYFLERNHHAKVYIRRNAFEGYYTKFLNVPLYVGLDARLKDCEQIEFTDDEIIIDQELRLFSNVSGNVACSRSNLKLFQRKNGKLQQDRFEHEQNLIISEEGSVTLFAGCAHKGIINILERGELILNRPIDYVIGGLHLYNPVTRRGEKKELIQLIGELLSKTESKFYTCHCTGVWGYQQLKNAMGGRIQYLSTGCKLTLS